MIEKEKYNKGIGEGFVKQLTVISKIIKVGIIEKMSFEPRL